MRLLKTPKSSSFVLTGFDFFLGLCRIAVVCSMQTSGRWSEKIGAAGVFVLMMFPLLDFVTKMWSILALGPLVGMNVHPLGL